MSKQAVDLMGTALILASRGRFVFPCLPCDKRPATARGYKDATIDPDVIRQWWHQEPNYNLAIATGAISKIFCIDLDGLDAEGELRKLEAEHGELPATVEVCTARGRHIYFQMPDVPVRNSAGKIAPGIDVRADGGYALVPPSVHPSGRTYCWSVDCTRTFAPPPDWLLAKIAERRARRRQQRRQQNGKAWFTTASAKASATTALRGWPVICCGGALMRCSPLKSYSRLTKRVAVRHLSATR